MTFKQFADKVGPLLKENEPISMLRFYHNGKKYAIISQYGSGENGEEINLWAKIIADNSDRIYPFFSRQVEKLKFFIEGK